MSDPLTAFTRTSSLAATAGAIARASTRYRPLLVYVERRPGGFRWSPAHRGGPYPLLRTAAVVLGVDHHRLVLPFRPVPGNGNAAWRGLSIVGDPRDPAPGRWTVLTLEAATPAGEVEDRLAAAFELPRLLN